MRCACQYIRLLCIDYGDLKYLFQKRVVRTKFDIYAFNMITCAINFNIVWFHE